MNNIMMKYNRFLISKTRIGNGCIRAHLLSKTNVQYCIGFSASSGSPSGYVSSRISLRRGIRRIPAPIWYRSALHFSPSSPRRRWGWGVLRFPSFWQVSKGAMYTFGGSLSVVGPYEKFTKPPTRRIRAGNANII